MVVIEAFQTEDLLGVMGLAARVLPEAYPYDFYLKMAQTQGDYFRVARDEATGHVVGFIIATRSPGLEGNVLLIAVDPDRQGRGLGRALLHDVERMLMLDDVRTVRLEVRTDNELALAFYRREGFWVEGLEPRVYRDGGDAFAMRKPLL